MNLNISDISSVAQSCPTLCDPMNCSTPGLPVHYQLPESTQTHVHWVSDAIQPSHPLLSCSLPALNLSQHQGLFKWVSSLHQVAKVLGVSASTSVPSNEHPGLICLDWLDLLAVQGTLKSLPEHSNHCMQNNRSYFLKFDTTDFNINLSLSFVFLTKTSVFFLMFSHIISKLLSA